MTTSGNRIFSQMTAPHVLALFVAVRLVVTQNLGRRACHRNKRP